MPYDYSSPSYSRLGYLAEGFTTYLGNLILKDSGIFDTETYLKHFEKYVNLHFNNHARFNMPVSEASFDTWLDGYEEGIPGRKTNIYVEGCIIAFVLDGMIRKNTNHQKSLYDFMRYLYNEYGKQKKGITQDDIQKTMEKIVKTNVSSFFEKYVFGTEDLLPVFQESLQVFGYEVYQEELSLLETYVGMKLNNDKIDSVYPGSPAELAGVCVGDHVTEVNGIRVNGNAKEWMNFFLRNGSLELGLVDQFSRVKRKTLFFQDENQYYLSYKLTSR
jgi:predicted metalloprotease with PDZ domain